MSVARTHEEGCEPDGGGRMVPSSRPFRTVRSTHPHSERHTSALQRRRTALMDEPWICALVHPVPSASLTVTAVVRGEQSMGRDEWRDIHENR
jgi:hypothetical protein